MNTIGAGGRSNIGPIAYQQFRGAAARDPGGTRDEFIQYFGC
jgi:hypothetical protein